MWVSIARPRPMRGSLSQFGPSCAVSLKITELITPHSGLNMKRIEKMVGIEGTAQGMMKITESQRIQTRSCTKNPESHSASRNFRLTATNKKTTVLTTVRTKIDRKSTRLNSSHSSISYAVFCLKKKKKKKKINSHKTYIRCVIYSY